MTATQTQPVNPVTGAPVSAPNAMPLPSNELEQLYMTLLVIQPSPFCNINCDYCYLPDRGNKTRMTFETLENVMGKVFDSGMVGPPFTLLWHAGEPLAVPLKWYEEAFEIINRFPNAKQLVEHNFQTNGTLVNQKWIDFILKHKIEVGVSIDGPEFIHDHHRKTRKGGGTHAKAMRGYKMLREAGVNPGVVSVISDIAVDHPDEIYDFFIENDINGVGFNIEEVEGANASSSLGDVNMDGDERIRRFLTRIYDRNKADGFPLRIREFETAKMNILEPHMTHMPDGRYYNSETDPFGMINVDCFGNFSTFSPELLGQPTEKYGTFNFGNVIKHSFFDATKNKAFQQVLEDIDAGNRKCAESCPFWNYCGGASPSNKYYENGTFDSTETANCRSTVQIPLEIVLEDLEHDLQLPAVPIPNADS
ncbi:MAG: GRRM system radical SAM/SPASM domain protein [Verrucomicrobiales bacterium]|nr:GRRM system radical SAM/SPASM domain protein [Verrucomicrobiales bacterium]